MRETRIVMGMPCTVEIVADECLAVINSVFEYFTKVDERFSTYKPTSEISAINRGEISPADFSVDMREVFDLAARTKFESDGFFEIKRADGKIDPSGIVKGWAIRNAARMIAAAGFSNFYVDVGGDIQTGGCDADGKAWRIGIRSPFNDQDVIKAIELNGHGVATSGTYVRGQHIYNPLCPTETIKYIVSLTVIGADVLEADRFATAAFAIGEDGIYFIESLTGIEGYMVNASGIATQTSGFGDFVVS